MENSGNALFRLGEGENHDFQLLLAFGPGQQTFNSETKTNQRTLAAFNDIKMEQLTTGGLMDFSGGAE